MRLRHLGFLTASLTGFLIASSARASFVVYTTEASYLAAISDPGVDTYDDLPGSPVNSPLNRTAGSYTYVARTDNGSDFFPAGTDADRWLATDTATVSIVFDTFSAGVIGVGGFFFNSDINGETQTGRSVVVTAVDSSGSETQTLINTTPSSFLGFVSDGEITSLTVTADNSNVVTWATVNNLTLGQAVPEPSSILLCALGGGISVVAVSRRRKA